MAASGDTRHAPSSHHPQRAPPLKQKMALGFRSLVDGAKKLSLFSPTSTGGFDDGNNKTADITELFPATTPEVDGDSCSHDCDSCHISYPRGFKIDESDLLYGHVKGWSTHVLVATGKADWVRDVEDEKGSVMQAFGRAHKPANGRLMLSASNMPTPNCTTDYSEPTTVLLLPAFVAVRNVTPAAVPALVDGFVGRAPTTADPLAPVRLPRSLALDGGGGGGGAEAPLPLEARQSPHAALILLCSQKTRDARCGQSAPLLRKELERHLRPLGLFRDLDDERPGGVGIYFISHVGGHKYSANVMVYRRPDAFGVDGVERARLAPGEEVWPVKKVPKRTANGEPKAVVAAEVNGNGEASNGVAEKNGEAEKSNGETQKSNGEMEKSNGETEKNGVDAAAGEGEEEDDEDEVGAGQCIWLARVKPEDCENLVKYTVLQGKVVKPDTQLRGGFDRGKGLMSW